MSEPISSLMRRRVSSVDMDDTVAQVEAYLSELDLNWVPVLEPTKREVTGVISASDLLAFHSQGRDAAATRAWQMCTYKPVVVDAETPIAMVAALMVERGIHHVVVTDRNGIAGVVSSLDFVRTFVPDDRR